MADCKQNNVPGHRIVGCFTILMVISLTWASWSNIMDMPLYLQIVIFFLILYILARIGVYSYKSPHLIQISAPQAFFDAGKYADALKHTEEVIHKTPSNSEAYYLKGQCHDRLGDTAQAMAAWRKAIELKPSHPGASHDLACEYMDRGEYLTAADYFSEAIKGEAMFIEPTTFEKNITNIKRILTSKGIQAERARDYATALKYANARVHIEPDFATAYAWRASQHFSLGQYEKAIEDAETCLRLDPQYTKANLVIESAIECLNRQAVNKE